MIHKKETETQQIKKSLNEVAEKLCETMSCDYCPALDKCNQKIKTCEKLLKPACIEWLTHVNEEKDG